VIWESQVLKEIQYYQVAQTSSIALLSIQQYITDNRLSCFVLAVAADLPSTGSCSKHQEMWCMFQEDKWYDFWAYNLFRI